MLLQPAELSHIVEIIRFTTFPCNLTFLSFLLVLWVLNIRFSFIHHCSIGVLNTSNLCSTSSPISAHSATLSGNSMSLWCLTRCLWLYNLLLVQKECRLKGEPWYGPTAILVFWLVCHTSPFLIAPHTPSFHSYGIVSFPVNLWNTAVSHSVRLSLPPSSSISYIILAQGWQSGLFWFLTFTSSWQFYFHFSRNFLSVKGCPL